ncbi:hypothetical protein [Methanobrevibacter sp. UBA188]|nr:hypothetical protein [Methanobrevibacter sp. UBA188]
MFLKQTYAKLTIVGILLNHFEKLKVLSNWVKPVLVINYFLKY